MMINNTIKGIYIHIPFCKDICHYCDFTKVYYNEATASEYLRVLKKEISSYQIDKDLIESIYIGGGTPSSLNDIQLRQLFEIINVDEYQNLKEFTFEANPDQLDENKIKILKDNCVNRVSLGVQSFNDEILKSLNRFHTKEDVYKIIKLLRKYKINNISIDLMYGFNNQSIEDIKNDLKEVAILNIKHLSYYSLILEANTTFYNNNYQVNDDEFEFDRFIEKTLVDEYKFEHYEVSNYAQDKQYSFHNLLYWNNDKYYGFGLGACGYIKNYRYYNTKSITKYLKEDFDLKYEYYQDDRELLKDEILLSFRKFNGINLQHINDKYDLDFTFLFKNVIIKNKNKIYIKDDYLYFYEEGKLFLNDVISDFIDLLGE